LAGAGELARALLDAHGGFTHDWNLTLNCSEYMTGTLGTGVRSTLL